MLVPRIIKSIQLWNQLMKSCDEKGSVRANNCALCRDGIITDIHSTIQGIVNVPALGSECTQSKASVMFVFLVFLRMLERKDIWQSRYYTIPRLYMTLAGLWPYHPIHYRYLHFVSMFTICSIILIPMVYNQIKNNDIISYESFYFCVKNFYIRSVGTDCLIFLYNNFYIKFAVSSFKQFDSV